jgi:hypothetical protein
MNIRAARLQLIAKTPATERSSRRCITPLPYETWRSPSLHAALQVTRSFDQQPEECYSDF